MRVEILPIAFTVENTLDYIEYLYAGDIADLNNEISISIRHGKYTAEIELDEKTDWDSILFYLQRKGYDTLIKEGNILRVSWKRSVV